MRAVVKMPEAWSCQGQELMLFLEDAAKSLSMRLHYSELLDRVQELEMAKVVSGRFTHAALQSFGTKCKLLQRCSSSRFLATEHSESPTVVTTAEDAQTGKPHWASCLWPLSRTEDCRRCWTRLNVSQRAAGTNPNWSSPIPTGSPIIAIGR